MATVNLATSGHEAVEDVASDGAISGTLGAGHKVAIVYDDTVRSAELIAALDLCRAGLLQALP